MEGSRSTVDRIDYEAAARAYGTPLYLYDMDGALEHLAGLRRVMPACVDIYYAMKANPSPRLLEIYRPHVSGLDISSTGEMRVAQRVGFAASQMSFAGPGKTDDDLRAALAQELQVISVESASELERLSVVARNMGHRARITLRINPETVPNAFMMKMGGRASQFGIAEEDIARPLERVRQDDTLDLLGFHVYAGTQCLDHDAILENLGQTLAINQRLADQYDLSPELVNLGGGFGIPYFPGQRPLDHGSLWSGIAGLIEAFVAGQQRFSRARFILELGRYLIGPFGTYLARVVEVKETRGKRFVILDGGMNHCFPATGNFGQLVKKNFHVSNLSGADRDPSLHELVGPLCTPLDSMARSLELPRAEAGDMIAFHQSGAYAFTASPLLFLGHETPAEVVKLEGQLELARRRISPLEFV